MTDVKSLLEFGTATGRWAGLGPYYAMFPLEFAFNVIQKYSQPGDAILDPFAGRASSVFAAASMLRSSLGVEINPVGWLYGHAKLHPAPKARVLSRVRELGEIANTISSDSLPEFFEVCFAPRVLRFLLAARNTLRWKTNSIDATLMALVLVYLHGKYGQALSNQMRQGKSMSPDYSVRWWRERELTPPDVDPIMFMSQRIEWRYARGIPNLAGSKVILGDSRVTLRKISSKVSKGEQKPFDLLFTSPPYYAITNYHYDQWLRLWMLGGTSRPRSLEGDYQGKFECKESYRALLHDVFGQCAKMMSDTATIYVRTDARLFTFTTTLEVLCDVFPHKTLETISQPFRRSTQTALFGDKSQKPGEVDIILR